LIEYGKFGAQRVLCLHVLVVVFNTSKTWRSFSHTFADFCWISQWTNCLQTVTASGLYQQLFYLHIQICWSVSLLNLVQNMPTDNNGIWPVTVILWTYSSLHRFKIALKNSKRFSIYKTKLKDVQSNTQKSSFTQISDRSKKFKTLLNLQEKIERCLVKYTKIVVFNLYYAFQFGAFLARQLSQLFFSHCQYDQLITNQTSFLFN